MAFLGSGLNNNASERPPLLPGSSFYGNISATSSVFDLPVQGSGAVPSLTPLNIHGDTPTPLDSRIQSPTSSHATLSASQPPCLVISGGTGCNNICAAFDDACYILPVSDNGGSSSEIIRVLGGPSIGDIRSRLIRLIPDTGPNSPSQRIKTLLSYRFPSEATEHEARDIWREIVEGRSKLWRGIPADRKETIRGFLVYFDGEVLKRANKNFSFRNASVGNFLLTAAHLFFRSVPSAIFLFSSITGSKANILPVLVTNHTVTIAAELQTGKIIVGQCEISHPSRPILPSIVTSSSSELKAEVLDDDDDAIWSPIGDAMGEESHSSVQNVSYTKGSEDEHESLGSPISRVFYINQHGQEVFPLPNPGFLKNLNTRELLVYSCGSLYTSIIPCLALQGVASAIARSRTLRAKVLLLNSENDRETEGYTAADYIRAVTHILNRHDTVQNPGHRRRESAAGSAIVREAYPISAFVTHLVYLRDTFVPVDVEEIRALGVQCIEVEGPREGKLRFDEDSVRVGLHKVLQDA